MAQSVHPLRTGQAVSDDDLIVRAAWAYYVEGLTQGEVAERLKLNRVRVNRMLREARERGLVQIRINSSLAVALERQVESQFGIASTVIVPTPDDPAMVPNAIAVAAGAQVSGHLRENMSIGVGWGRTLQLSLQSMERRTIGNLTVVSLLGGLTRGSTMNAYETASRLAGLHGAECLYIAGPALADTPETRDILLQQSILKDALDHARKVDVAVVSAGALTADTTMARLGIISEADRLSLVEAGAVGDICAHWINKKGETIDHPVNRRVIALPPDALRDVKTVILASGGMEKVPVIRAALRRGIVHTLVTDESTAQALLLDESCGSGQARE
ncbi:MAG: sugar-binding transcriptional regulator [Pseudomonadota bacterium]